MNDTAHHDAAIFTPQAVAAMNRAYDEACDLMKAAGASLETRVRVGEHIMFLARNGETDQHKLCDLAIQKALGHGL